MRITRHLLLLPAFLVLGCNKNDSDDVRPNEVPEAVRTTFAARFPTTTNLEWEKIGNTYEADFKVNNVDYEALLEANGTLLKYKYDIVATELPAAVQTAISQNYAGLRIDDTERLYVGSSAEAVPLYQVELDATDPTPDVKLVYSADGQTVTEPAYWD